MEAIADNTFKHPSLSLVSHGAECVVIHKKLFMDHAPLKLLDKLREQVSVVLVSVWQRISGGPILCSFRFPSTSSHSITSPSMSPSYLPFIPSNPLHYSLIPIPSPILLSPSIILLPSHLFLSPGSHLPLVSFHPFLSLSHIPLPHPFHPVLIFLSSPSYLSSIIPPNHSHPFPSSTIFFHAISNLPFISLVFFVWRA